MFKPILVVQLTLPLTGSRPRAWKIRDGQNKLSLRVDFSNEKAGWVIRVTPGLITDTWAGSVVERLTQPDETA